MKSTLSEKILTWEREIRSGKGDRVRAALARLNLRRLSREARVQLARLAWRSGTPLTGARLLGPRVRPRFGAPTDISGEEGAEYAACLAFAGSIWESLELLSSIDHTRCPRATLYEAIVRARQWEYDVIIKLLRRYLSLPSQDPYLSLVARVNLASAFVNEGLHTQATQLIRTLVLDTSIKRYGLLYANLYEIGAENFLAQGKVDRAMALLQEAERALGESNDIYAFLVRKWNAIAGLMERPASGAAHARLKAVREEATRIGHWETLRECDRFQAIARNDRPLLEFLYFGTPYRRFREKLEAAHFGKAPLPPDYVWTPGGSTSGAKVTVDLLTGNVGERPGLEPGQLAHRLLVALASDFYRSFSINELFEPLFPGEHFSMGESAGRVHRALGLLRRALKGLEVPLRVQESKGRYRLESTGACGLRVPRESADVGARDFPLAQLRRDRGESSFSAKQAAQILRSSERTTRRLLTDAVGDGKISRVGSRRGTRYQFSK